MDALKRTKRVTIGAIIIVIALIIGLLSYKRPMTNYKLSPQQMADEISLIYQVTPDEAMELLDDSSTVFVDVRNIYDYEKGHLGNAINISIPDLLNEENLDMFNHWLKDSVTVVLYGNDELQANASWMLMYELGYTNTRVLMGGCSYIDRLYDGQLSENESYSVEDPAYDYAGIIKKASEQSGTPAVEQKKKKKVVVRKKKKKEAEGGC